MMQITEFDYVEPCWGWYSTWWLSDDDVTFLKIWYRVTSVCTKTASPILAFFLYFYIYFFAVDFLDGFEAKSPQHLALRPMYVRSYTPVPSQHAKQHHLSPSKHTQSPSNKSKAAPLQLRGTDMIRLYSSDSGMNSWGSGHTEHHLAMSRKQMVAMQPRPKSLYTPRQNSEYVWWQAKPLCLWSVFCFHSERY